MPLRNYQKFSITILSIVAIIFLHNSARAADYQQTDDSTNSEKTEQTWVQVLSNTSATQFQGTFQAAQLKLAFPSTTSTPEVVLHENADCVDHEGNPGAYPGGAGVLTMPLVGTITTTSSAFYNFASSSSFTTNPAKCYYFVINAGGGKTVNVAGTTDGSSWPGYIFNSMGPPFESVIADAYFRISSDSAFLTLEFPTSATDTDFANWIVDLSALGSNLEAGSTVSVSYTIGLVPYTDSIIWYPINPLHLRIPKSRPLYNLSQSNFTATASVTSPEGDLVAVSNPVSFDIVFPGGATYDPSAYTGLSVASSTAGLIEDCSPYLAGGFFSSSTLAGVGCVAKNVIYSAFQFIFVPHDNFTDFLSSSTDKMKAVPPFSVVFGINKGITDKIDAMVSASSSDTLYFPIHLETGTSSVAVWGPDILTNVGFDDTYRTWWYNLILTLFIVACVVAVYKTIHRF